LPSLAPKVDADGNETAGAPSVLHEAPLGTYLGWNVTAGGFYKGQGCGFTGGYIPSLRPGPSGWRRRSAPVIGGAIRTHEAYVAAVNAAAHRLVADRLLPFQIQVRAGAVRQLAFGARQRQGPAAYPPSHERRMSVPATSS